MSIPSALKPKYEYEMIRIGSRNDGGYLVEKKSLYDSEFLFSFGVSTDWNFEKDFIKYNNINFKCYDGSINDNFWKVWKKRSLKKILKLSFKDYFDYLTTFNSFIKFFNEENFESVFIGNQENYLSLLNVIKETNSNKIFFKIDIEGSEYDILNDLIKIKDRITGIAIEFHDCDKNINQIVKFVNEIGMSIAHIHANNYGMIGKNNIPRALEITLTHSNSKIAKFSKLPHKLDRPNKRSRDDIKIIFSDEKNINN